MPAEDVKLLIPALAQDGLQAQVGKRSAPSYLPRRLLMRIHSM